MTKGLISDLEDQMFILTKQLDILSEVAASASAPRFVDFRNEKAIRLLLTEARKFALDKILPTNEIGDTRGAEFEDGEVDLPIEFFKLYNDIVDGGWLAMTEALDLGGEFLPHVLALACQEWFTGSNFAFMMYPGLAREVGKLLEKYPDVKGLSKEAVTDIIKGLYGGTNGGTMCLTEPQAGSDVGCIETSAVVNSDNSYTITGSKIFITNGEHRLTDNIMHAVLARIEGAAKGTKGISLFLVPKLIDDKNNNVKCGGIEEKMGIHGNGTCTMSFDGAKGWLIGEENKGMKIMFSLMNEARLMVASQGLGAAAAGYQYALDYAKTRVQGRAIEDFADHGAEPVAIINHPDVRRQLMYMKSHVEGMRSLLYWIVFNLDQKEIYEAENDKETAQKHQDFVNLLTSLAKGVLTDRAVKVVNQAMQVYGGHGYIRENKIEQLLRDVRITPIYEGTNGIQAMDFLFRQVPYKSGVPMMNLIQEIKDSLSGLKLSEVQELEAHLDRAAEIILGLLGKAPKYGAGYAHVVMDAVGDLLIAWQLLLRAKVGNAENIYTMKFFFKNVLPANMALLESLDNPEPSHLIADIK